MYFNVGTQAQISVAPGFIPELINDRIRDAPEAAKRWISLGMLSAGMEANHVAAAFNQPQFFYLSLARRLIGIFLTWRGFKSGTSK